MAEEILVETNGYIRTIKLNRPDRLNAITSEMLSQLERAFREADDEVDVRVIILTGAGRGFCSGLDLKDAAAGKGIGGSGTLSPGGGASHISTRDIVTVTLNRIDTPVICALNGVAAGYGLDLALGCDMRIMSDAAKIMPGFAKRGVVPESGGTWYLPRMLGWAKACEISFLAEDLSPERSLELELVNKVVPAADFEAETLKWAETIAGNAPLAIKAMKRLFRHGLSQDFESHSHHVLMQLLLLMKSEDFGEGVMAFIEKRDPEFKGR